MRENADQKNFEYRHFSRSGCNKLGFSFADHLFHEVKTTVLKLSQTIPRNLPVAWQVNELPCTEKTATVYSCYKDLREFTRVSKNFYYKKVN